MKSIKMIATVFLALVFFNSSALANHTSAHTDAFKAGKDYVVLAKHRNHNVPVSDQRTPTVTVEEFFSYGCPSCFRLEPDLLKWKKNQGKHVQLRRVPVVFNQQWVIFAKAYYVAEALGIIDKINPALFDAIHNKNQQFKTQDDMIAFFVKHGAKKQKVEQAFTASPSIDAQVKLGNQLMKSYQVLAVPTLVVDGKYKTDMQMVRGDVKRLFSVVNTLAAKKKA